MVIIIIIIKAWKYRAELNKLNQKKQDKFPKFQWEKRISNLCWSTRHELIRLKWCILITSGFWLVTWVGQFDKLPDTEYRKKKFLLVIKSEVLKSGVVTSRQYGNRSGAEIYRWESFGSNSKSVIE